MLVCAHCRRLCVRPLTGLIWHTHTLCLQENGCGHTRTADTHLPLVINDELHAQEGEMADYEAVCEG